MRVKSGGLAVTFNAALSTKISVCDNRVSISITRDPFLRGGYTADLTTLSADSTTLTADRT